MSRFIHGRTHIAGGYRVAIGLVGPKWIQVVYLVDGDRLVLRRRPAREARYFTELPGYPERAQLARRLLRRRTLATMTRSARDLLIMAKQ